MQVAETNVLLYAVDDRSPHHDQLRRWLEGLLDGGSETLGFAWQVVLGFLRLSTSPAVFPLPLAVEEAVAAVEQWLSRPNVVVLEPTSRHLGVVRGLLADVGTAGNLVNDAHIAALAIEHGAEVVSFDRDFARFEGVRWRLPG